MTIEKQKAGFKFGKNTVKVLGVLGEVQHNGRIYRRVRVRVDNGEEYDSLRLYNARGKFIKQMMTEPEIAPAIGDLYGSQRLVEALNETEEKAWRALAGYKFQMFGYWAAIWVHLNKVSHQERPNPFIGLVKAARERGQHESTTQNRADS